MPPCPASYVGQVEPFNGLRLATLVMAVLATFAWLAAAAVVERDSRLQARDKAGLTATPVGVVTVVVEELIPTAVVTTEVKSDTEVRADVV